MKWNRHPSKLQVTTWILGTEIAIISIAYTILFIVPPHTVDPRDALFWFMGIIWALILPVFVTDHRVSLRGTSACVIWGVIAVAHAIFLLLLGIVCLVSVLIASWCVFCIYFKIGLPKLFVRSKCQLHIHVSNKYLAICVYYAIVLLVFFLIRPQHIGRWLFLPMPFISLSLLIYVIYYWNWILRVDADQFSVSNFGKSHTYPYRDIHKDIYIPVFGHFLKNSNGKILCRYTGFMDNYYKLLLSLRKNSTH